MTCNVDWPFSCAPPSTLCSLDLATSKGHATKERKRPNDLRPMISDYQNRYLNKTGQKYIWRTLQQYTTTVQYTVRQHTASTTHGSTGTGASSPSSPPHPTTTPWRTVQYTTTHCSAQTGTDRLLFLPFLFLTQPRRRSAHSTLEESTQQWPFCQFREVPEEEEE